MSTPSPPISLVITGGKKFSTLISITDPTYEKIMLSIRNEHGVDPDSHVITYDHRIGNRLYTIHLTANSFHDFLATWATDRSLSITLNEKPKDVTPNKEERVMHEILSDFKLDKDVSWAAIEERINITGNIVERCDIYRSRLQAVLKKKKTDAETILNGGDLQDFLEHPNTDGSLVIHVTRPRVHVIRPHWVD